MRAVAEHVLDVARDRTRLFLACAFGAFGGYWDERMRFDSKGAETDMVESPGEQFYAQLYLESIFAILPNRSGLRILDAGCQAGRLAIPLARAGHSVTGVDISARWIDRCAAHCKRAGVHVDLLCEDISTALSRFASGFFDVVVCTELLYTRQDFATILNGSRAVLREEGRLVASHRTRYYVAAMLVRYRKFAAAADVLSCDEGTIMGNYFNWFDEDELKRIYAKAGFSVTETRGIGTLSGIGVDGLAGVVSPSDLAPDERGKLLRLEQFCAVPYRQNARYLLVSAEPVSGDRP